MYFYLFFDTFEDRGECESVRERERDQQKQNGVTDYRLIKTMNGYDYIIICMCIVIRF